MSSCVYYSKNFNSLLLLRPLSSTCMMSARAQVIYKWPHLPLQVDSWQEITAWSAGKTGNGFSHVLWYVRLKIAWIDDIWSHKRLWIKTPTISSLPTTPVGVLLVMTTLWNKLSTMATHYSWKHDPPNYHEWM